MRPACAWGWGPATTIVPSHFLRHRRHWRHPRLIGLAYSFQQVPHIKGAPHDVHLDRVITEKGLIKCNSGC